MIKANPEKLKEKFGTSEELFAKYVGSAGSPERKQMQENAIKWFYGEILRDRRKKLKLSQSALAEEVGLKQSYIARLEKGEVDIQFSSLLRLTSALGMRLLIQ